LIIFRSIVVKISFEKKKKHSDKKNISLEYRVSEKKNMW